MSNVVFIGDTHFGHRGISEKFRTHFTDDDEHSNVIHSNVMEFSGKRNSIFLLGDVFFNPSEFWRLDEYSKYYNQVWFCLGNHDHKDAARYAAQFGNVQVFGIIKRYGFWLSHAPIHPQELYRGFSIHGHVHSNTVPDMRYLSTSCEAVGYKPISLEEVRAEFEARKGLGYITNHTVHRD